MGWGMVPLQGHSRITRGAGDQLQGRILIEWGSQLQECSY
jgi:hypothetical protein